ncbi:MAG: BatD family protein [Halioglobus sp.]
MKPISRITGLLVTVWLALAGTVALAAVTTSLDRDSVALGDTLRLTITTTEDEEVDDRALRPLQADFEILQRSTSSNTTIINGRMSQNRQLVLELSPRHQGNLEIPPLHIGSNTTARIPVVVGAAPDIHTAGQSVVFEAEVDQHSVYVQGQVILTLRVLQAVNLEGRSISELKLDNAFVKPLEQHSFQRTIDGRPWLVDEIRYAIFPEQSGTLEIPAQVFSGRMDQGRRSFFDFGSSGKLVRRSTEPLAIEVLPKPASYTADTWLPAQRLAIEETWSTPPEQLRVGESATRTVRITGDGLQGAQLPPVMFTPTDGLKYYPDQPKISEREIAGGLEGVREDSAAVVPTRAGTYLLPEIRIPWWDTQTRQLQYAVLPEREITVMAAAPGSGAATPAAAPAAASGQLTPEGTPPVATITPAPSPVWQMLAVASTAGWLLTLLYLWWSRRPVPVAATPDRRSASEQQAFRELLAACAAGNASAARAALLQWAAALHPAAGPVSLERVGRQFGDEELRQQLEQLDASLYRPRQERPRQEKPGRGDWSGERLADCARRLRAGHKNNANSPVGGPLELYPQGN